MLRGNTNCPSQRFLTDSVKLRVDVVAIDLGRLVTGVCLLICGQARCIDYVWTGGRYFIGEPPFYLCFTTDPENGLHRKSDQSSRVLSKLT